MREVPEHSGGFLVGLVIHAHVKHNSAGGGQRLEGRNRREVPEARVRRVLDGPVHPAPGAFLRDTSREHRKLHSNPLARTTAHGIRWVGAGAAPDRAGGAEVYVPDAALADEG